MAEDIFLKYAQPILLGIGLIVVLNIWNLIQLILDARKSKDKKTDKAIEKLNDLVIRMTFEIEHLQKDVNNLGQIVRDIRSGMRNG